MVIVGLRGAKTKSLALLIIWHPWTRLGHLVSNFRERTEDMATPFTSSSAILCYTSDYLDLCCSKLECGNLTSKYWAKLKRNNFFGPEFLEVQ